MITLRRTEERAHLRRRDFELWLTFHVPGPTEPLAGGFRALESVAEILLRPRTAIPQGAGGDAEVLTYVRDGELAYEDSSGVSGVVSAGEFLLMPVFRDVGHIETNSSRTNPAHVFQIWLHSSRTGLHPRSEKQRFSVAERRGRLRVVAASDRRNGSLYLRQDALVHSALLDPGAHVAYALSAGRSAWLHVVQGEATLDDAVVRTGDSGGFADERVVSLTTRKSTELLLVDLGPWDAATPVAPHPTRTPRPDRLPGAVA